MKTKLDALIAAHREAVDAFEAAEAARADDKTLDKLRAAEWQAFVEVAHYEPATDEEFSREAEHVCRRLGRLPRSRRRRVGK